MYSLWVARALIGAFMALEGPLKALRIATDKWADEGRKERARRGQP